MWQQSPENNETCWEHRKKNTHKPKGQNYMNSISFRTTPSHFTFRFFSISPRLTNYAALLPRRNDQKLNVSISHQSVDDWKDFFPSLLVGGRITRRRRRKGNIINLSGDFSFWLRQCYRIPTSASASTSCLLTVSFSILLLLLVVCVIRISPGPNLIGLLAGWSVWCVRVVGRTMNAGNIINQIRTLADFPILVLFHRANDGNGSRRQHQRKLIGLMDFVRADRKLWWGIEAEHITILHNSISKCSFMSLWRDQLYMV